VEKDKLERESETSIWHSVLQCLKVKTLIMKMLGNHCQVWSFNQGNDIIGFAF
jgi:hypothetical protein